MPMNADCDGLLLLQQGCRCVPRPCSFVRYVATYLSGDIYPMSRACYGCLADVLRLFMMVSEKGVVKTVSCSIVRPFHVN